MTPCTPQPVTAAIEAGVIEVLKIVSRQPIDMTPLWRAQAEPTGDGVDVACHGP